MTEKTYIDRRFAKAGENFSDMLIDLSANGSEFVVRGMSKEYFDNRDIQLAIQNVKMARKYCGTN